MQTTDPAAQALLRRARRGILLSAINGAIDRFHFWQGVASAAEDIVNGNALRMAANDASNLADQEQTSLEAAWAALPVGVKHLTMADVQRLLAAQGIESAADLVAHRDIGTGLHCMAFSASKAAMVGQQGGAA